MFERTKVDVKEGFAFRGIDELELGNALKLEIELIKLIRCIRRLSKRLIANERDSVIHLLEGDFGNVFMEEHFKRVFKRFEKMGQYKFGLVGSRRV